MCLDFSGVVGDENSFVEPSPKPQRKSTRLLKRISSTTSFDLNVLSVSDYLGSILLSNTPS